MIPDGARCARASAWAVVTALADYNRRQRLARLAAAELEIVPILPAVWQAAYVLARDCRAARVTIPPTDLVVAACAEHHHVGLLHRDSHFDRIAAARARRRP
mgnify:CR=1 FL=1